MLKPPRTSQSASQLFDNNLLEKEGSMLSIIASISQIKVEELEKQIK